jgi:hypothetical protein
MPAATPIQLNQLSYVVPRSDLTSYMTIVINNQVLMMAVI